jgi:hypothetical protein
MGENNLKIRIKHRYDTEANWNKNNPVLLSGEVAISSDKSGKHKVGDGTHKWSELSYAKAELTKGDVTGALGYTPPAKDTWRGIQNNLISTATDQSLSAAQGKWLNENKATITTLTNGNLDKITTPGFYNAGGGNSVTNKPSGVDNFGMIVVHSASGNYYTQIVYVDDKSYRRICRNGTWGNWSQDILTDTKYTHPGYTAKSSGLYKITVDGTGHVSATTAVTKSDITALGIPGQDTNTTYSTGTSSTPGLAKLYTGTGSATDGTMTQKAITDGLNSKSGIGHTHNYAGSSSAGGVANSAAKLSTTRTVSGGTDITMSFNYNGSSNSSANIGFYGSAASVGDKNNYPFHRFAKLDTIASSYSDRSTTFFISQDYSGGGFGIVRIVLRTNNNSSVSSVEVKWLVRCGLNADSVQVGLYNVFGKTYADAFFKTGGSYAGTYFRAIASGARGNATRTWVMINSSEVSGTTTTDAKTSTECYVTIAAAGTKLHNQAYTNIVSGVDSGSTSYANSAGNSTKWNGYTLDITTANTKDTWLLVANNNMIQHKLTTDFADSKHTHNYAGSGSAGGSANSAVKLDTTTAGSATQPVYFSGGKPVACSYTLGKSVPADALFTDHTYGNMKGATSSAAGSAGLVPAPNIGEQLKFLRADGAWVIPTNTTYSVGTSSYLGITKLYTETGSATDGTMTQNAITSALNGKSPTSHTHNYAGSSSSGGAANSANKLATARTVSGGTDITLSFNYDGSGNSSANIGFYSSSASVGDKNNYPFHRFAKLDTIAASHSDKSTTFFISQDYSGGGFGIVRIVLRTNNSSLASTVEVKWLVRCGLSADSVQVGIYNVFGKTYADAFFKTGGSYAGTCFRTLASGARGGISRTWVLVNSSEVSGTSATDAKTSTECYATIAAAGTALHKQAYSSIVSGTDSGTASYANSAGSANSVAWGNVTGKPSTFAPSSHTHNYAGSSSAGGAADSAIKLNTSRNITIGNSTKSFDGTTNLSWSLNEIGIPTKSDIAACAVMYGGTTLSSSATVTDSAAQYKVISRSTGSTGDIFTKSATLPKGLYSVMIRMKVSTISSSSNVFKLTIVDGSTTTTKYIRPSMFKTANGYTTLGTAVENTSGTLRVTLSIYNTLSNQTVCVDYLAITPAMVGVTSIA